MITYYDLREDGSEPELKTDYWSIVSRDGGASWQESQIGRTFDHATAAIARGYFLGDYQGLAVGGNSDLFRAVFGQSSGTTEDRASDIEESEATEIP